MSCGSRAPAPTSICLRADVALLNRERPAQRKAAHCWAAPRQAGIVPAVSFAAHSYPEAVSANRELWCKNRTERGLNATFIEAWRHLSHSAVDMSVIEITFYRFVWQRMLPRD